MSLTIGKILGRKVILKRAHRILTAIIDPLNSEGATNVIRALRKMGREDRLSRSWTISSIAVSCIASIGA